MEVAAVRQDGTLSGWQLQAGATSPSEVHGLDALLIEGYLFAFHGAKSEAFGQDPSVHGNTLQYTLKEARIVDWPADGQGPADDVLYAKEGGLSAGSKMDTPRCYMRTVRTMGYIFGIGGNGGVGIGPLTSMDRVQQ
jgi:hypothetical protein